MATTEQKANEVIRLITEEEEEVMNVQALYPDREEWFSVSNKAYQLYLKKERRNNKLLQKQRHVSSTSNSTIQDWVTLNETLSRFALGIPVSATTSELRYVQEQAVHLPKTELLILDYLERYNMSPRWRAIQHVGRFQKFDAFKEFASIINAGLICYYRRNFISCFLTLAPVIEGVLLRWVDYKGVGEKPDFEDFRKFFRKSAERQPCPYNIQFHQVFSKVCDSILNKHLYKPSHRGSAHADFNRHLAIHLMKESSFGTKSNCIRLFILLDLMSELYFYEKRIFDSRNKLTGPDFKKEFDVYSGLSVAQAPNAAENMLLSHLK